MSYFFDFLSRLCSRVQIFTSFFLTVDVTEEPESSPARAIAVEDKPVKLNIRYIVLDILQILY